MSGASLGASCMRQEAAAALVTHGADVDAKTECKQLSANHRLTALHLAAAKGRLGIAKLLVAQVNARAACAWWRLPC